MKKPLFRLCVVVVLIVGLITGLGCDGSETREAVDDTVKELSGQKHVERMQKMKKTIQTTQDQQNERYQVLEEETKQGASE